MASGNDCPVCETNIGIFAVFKAPLPNRIRCPVCRERLEYGGTGSLIFVSIVLSCLIVVAAAAVFLLVGLETPIMAASAVIGVIVVGFTLLEVGVVLKLWYGEYRLQQVGKPRLDEEQESW